MYCTVLQCTSVHCTALYYPALLITFFVLARTAVIQISSPVTSQLCTGLDGFNGHYRAKKIFRN